MKTGASTKPVSILLVLILTAVFLLWFLVYRPASGERKLREAADLVEAGNYEAAVPLLRRMVGSSPLGKKAKLLLARCRTSLDDYRQAVPLWEEMAADPDPLRREEAAYHLGRLAQRRGDPGAAERLLTDYSRRYPDSPRGGEVQLALARVKRAAGELPAAREAYAKVLKSYPDSPSVRQAQMELGELNLAILFSPQVDEGSREYAVKPGDSLSAIASRFNTTPALLQKANQTKGDLIHAGQKLKVPARKFEVVVSKSQNTLMLLYGGQFFKIYSVGTGKHDSTPSGKFRVVTKLVDPPWYHDGEQIPPGDPRNILGTRWLGFEDPHADYGIHGTSEPGTVGVQSSAGCIRMLNRDVEELFDLLPRGTDATVVD